MGKPSTWLLADVGAAEVAKHSCNPSIQEAEAGRSLVYVVRARAARATQGNHGP